MTFCSLPPFELNTITFSPVLELRFIWMLTHSFKGKNIEGEVYENSSTSDATFTLKLVGLSKNIVNAPGILKK